MIKRVILALFAALLVAGCASPLKSTVSKDFKDARIQSIAILPVDNAPAGDADDRDIIRLLRKMTAEELRARNYRIIPFEDVDAKSRTPERPDFGGKTPSELTAMFGADAILYMDIKELDRKVFATYASLKLTAEYTLYSAYGERLWQSEYKMAESDIRLDKKPLELAVIKVYEPKVQRFVEAVLSALPQTEAKKARQSFFQWLP